MNRFLSDHTSPCNEHGFPVGASSLAKTFFQAPEMQRMYRLLRERAHSHRNWAVPDIRVTSLNTGFLSGATTGREQKSPVGVSLLAKTICQAPEMQRMYWPLREQAHSHRNWAVPDIRVASLNTGFLSGATTGREQKPPVGASSLAKTFFQAPEMQRMYWLLRERAHAYRS
jgi:hypothetical protein